MEPEVVDVGDFEGTCGGIIGAVVVHAGSVLPIEAHEGREG